ncbi:MAG: putative hydrolase of the superfamily [Actinomycetota bacterium]|jgi:putative hydrolase of the HAD superfamily|nr:putative hydrolase of the superfamily [Actinomycetota bacterium]MEA2557590.1 putative hydrolase of the superfamily [Actinomycetota bacterium]MEA2580944.1 putative hydrolase of the superfamily [Actinomycetota bacterium]
MRLVAVAIEMVFFDIGGVMYSDTIYTEALRRALRDMGAEFADVEFDGEYALARAAQSGSFRRRMAARFLGPGADTDALRDAATRYWAYPPHALEPDVKPCLEALTGRYRLGIIANQPSQVRDAMARDGIEDFFEIWGVSEDIGLEKPDPRLYAHVLYTAGVSPAHAVMLGDRLDYDVIPAKSAGMRAIWVLRGEAPNEPTALQLAESDASVTTLRDIPAVLATL